MAGHPPDLFPPPCVTQLSDAVHVPGVSRPRPRPAVLRRQEKSRQLETGKCEVSCVGTYTTLMRWWYGR